MRWFLNMSITNKDLIKNYYDQLAELEKQYWFNGLSQKSYIIRYDAIKKRIRELKTEQTEKD